MPLASASMMMNPMSVMPNPMLVRIQILEVSARSSSPRPNEVLPLFFLQLKRVAIQVLISFFLGESYSLCPFLPCILGLVKVKLDKV
jgi:hypothetical protein